MSVPGLGFRALKILFVCVPAAREFHCLSCMLMRSIRRSIPGDHFGLGKSITEQSF